MLSHRGLYVEWPSSSNYEVWIDIPYKIYMGVRTLERLSSSEETNLTLEGVSYGWRHETGKKEGAD